ncbi:MAG: hypothetical protein LBL25_02145 [Oscillospiraceae bacterium]|jgi:hypothetical protein|nr:hypothetical protein [Oscillospiraceae bacterium]
MKAVSGYLEQGRFYLTEAINHPERIPAAPVFDVVHTKTKRQLEAIPEFERVTFRERISTR